MCTHTHTHAHTHTQRHTWRARGRPSILISTLLQSADGKPRACQSRKPTHPSRHYLIIMISHTSVSLWWHHATMPFSDYITVGRCMPRLLSPRSQGQSAERMRRGPVGRVITNLTVGMKTSGSPPGGRSLILFTLWDDGKVFITYKHGHLPESWPYFFCE